MGHKLILLFIVITPERWDLDIRPHNAMWRYLILVVLSSRVGTLRYHFATPLTRRFQAFGNMVPSNGMSFTSTWEHSLSLQRIGQFFNMNPPSSNMEPHVRQELVLCKKEVIFCSRPVSRNLLFVLSRTVKTCSSWRTNSSGTGISSLTISPPGPYPAFGLDWPFLC